MKATPERLRMGELVRDAVNGRLEAHREYRGGPTAPAQISPVTLAKLRDDFAAAFKRNLGGPQ